MLSAEQLREVADEVERLGPEEALSLVLTVELSAAQRIERLSDIQAVVDELRRRGHRPSVAVRRSERGELHALALR